MNIPFVTVLRTVTGKYFLTYYFPTQIKVEFGCPKYILCVYVAHKLYFWENSTN